MKFIIFASVFSLSLGFTAFAQQHEVPVEGDHSLLTYDPPTQSFSTEQLDENGLIARPPGHGGGGGHPSPHPNPHPPGPHPAPHPNPPHPNPHPPGPHPPGPHPNPPHPNPHPPGHWNPYPGWHNGWHWGHDWHPGWWYAGMIFPPWVWIEVPGGYWQCTAFDANMQPFSQIGPDLDQAAYGALYACGGYNYQQFGCYIPEGYCQMR